MLDNVRADLMHYSRFCYGGRPVWRVLPRILYAHPASAAVVWHRLGHWAWNLRVPVIKQLVQVIYLLGVPVIRMYSGVQIQPSTRIGPGLAIMHFGGVVITRECEIGPNCLLYHNVSLVTMKNNRGPTIGGNFYAGVGTTVIGDLVIEDDVTVGAGSVVTRSIPANAVVAGVPAKILRYRGENENNAENRTARRTPARWMDPPEKASPVNATVSSPDAETLPTVSHER